MIIRFERELTCCPFLLPQTTPLGTVSDDHIFQSLSLPIADLYAFLRVPQSTERVLGCSLTPSLSGRSLPFPLHPYVPARLGHLAIPMLFT